METMMRPTWTDERLDEFAKRMDERFDRVDERFDRIDERFDESNRRIDEMSSQLVLQGKRLDLVVGALSSVQNSFVLGIVTLVGGLMAGFGAIVVLIATKL